MASASAARVPGGTTMPFSVVHHDVRDATRRARRSRRGRDRTTPPRSAAAPPSGTAAAAPSPRPSQPRPRGARAAASSGTRSGNSATRSLGHVGHRSPSDQVQRRRRDPGGGQRATRPPAPRSPCSARARRRRAGTARSAAERPGPLEEGLEVHEGRELARRLDAEPRGRCPVVKGDSVRTASAPTDRAAGEQVGGGREEASRGGAVEPRRRPRVAVQVEDHLARAPCQAPPEQGERGLLRSLHEHGVGSEPAQLTRDEERKPQVEERPVEDGERLDETEARIGAAVPPLRRPRARARRAPPRARRTSAPEPATAAAAYRVRPAISSRLIAATTSSSSSSIRSQERGPRRGARPTAQPRPATAGAAQDRHENRRDRLSSALPAKPEAPAGRSRRRARPQARRRPRSRSRVCRRPAPRARCAAGSPRRR